MAFILQDYTPDPILLIRTLFVLGAGLGVLLDSVPYFRQRYVAYGSRREDLKSTTNLNPLTWIDTFLSYPVPHSWFTHYYVLSVSLSLFWGWQIATRGLILCWIASYSSQDVEHSMPMTRIWLAWFLLLVQGYRRLHESVTLAKASTATMPLSIYGIGIIYYLFDSVGIWIEGSATLASTKPYTWVEFLSRVQYGLTPSIRAMIGIPLFLIASGIQNDCHRYLASLKKYTLPTHPIFNDIICPHYSMECIIYLSLAILAAPQGEYINKTILTTFIFTAINLGLVAKGTKEWTISKFGDVARHRWRMVPYIW